MSPMLPAQPRALRLHRRLPLLLLACAAITVLALAQTGNQPVASIAAPKPVRVSAGGTAPALFTVSVEQGFHLQSDHPSSDYLIPTTLQLQPSGGVSVAKLVWPPALERHLSFSAEQLSVFEGTFPLKAYIHATAQAVGTHELTGTFRYQACSDQLCRPPVSVPVHLKVLVQKAMVQRHR